MYYFSLVELVTAGLVFSVLCTIVFCFISIASTPEGGGLGNFKFCGEHPVRREDIFSAFEREYQTQIEKIEEYEGLLVRVAMNGIEK